VVPPCSLGESWRKNTVGHYKFVAAGYGDAHSFSCPFFFWGRGHGGRSPRRTQNTSHSTAISDNFAGSLHQDGTKQVWRCSHFAWFWSTSGLLSCWFSQQELPCQSFVGHSGHMTDTTGGISQFGKVVRYSGFANFTVAHFVANYYTVNSSQKSHLCCLHLRYNILSVYVGIC